jgi:hypothetical protein
MSKYRYIKNTFIYSSFKTEKMPGFAINFREPALLFMLTFIVCDLGVRAMLFFGGIPFSGRYFIPFTISISIFAAAGVIPVSNYIASKLLPSKKNISPQLIAIILLLIICISYSGKNLIPHFNKPWLQAFGKIIKEKTGKDEQAVILSNKLDERYGYYGNTESFIQFHTGKSWRIQKKIRNKNASHWVFCKKPPNLKAFSEKLKQISNKMKIPGKKIKRFAIIRTYGKKDLDAKLLRFEKLVKMKKIKTFSYKKNRTITLYEY